MTTSNALVPATGTGHVDTEGPWTTHVVCCSLTVAMCGADVSALTWELPDDLNSDCVVCADLEETGYCPLCSVNPVED